MPSNALMRRKQLRNLAQGCFLRHLMGYLAIADSGSKPWARATMGRPLKFLPGPSCQRQFADYILRRLSKRSKTRVFLR